METLRIILDYLFYIAEGSAAVISLLHFKTIKPKYWRYFAIFLMFIFLFETIGKFGNIFISFSKSNYYNYIVIPFEFFFFYWLYAIKSLMNIKLFFLFSLLYIISYIPAEFYFKDSRIIFSFNYTFGCLLLMILVLMEYYKQINSENILNFKQNKMFYVNLGITLFFIGTLPFFSFYRLLLNEYPRVFDIYWIYSLLSGIAMYVFFSMSFIWGKQSY